MARRSRIATAPQTTTRPRSMKGASSAVPTAVTLMIASSVSEDARSSSPLPRGNRVQETRRSGQSETDVHQRKHRRQNQCGGSAGQRVGQHHQRAGRRACDADADHPFASPAFDQEPGGIGRKDEKPDSDDLQDDEVADRTGKRVDDYGGGGENENEKAAQHQ